ncbi:hypothetical protein N657DRAFT_1021 [Parathielavia appendiculata]|uniref:Uncharacterized protein n=1 Tax=Parathielavia appendiculata TaxID=2587402 RepID=A0AAN6U8X3_9PEZI|nr:hypothetical protein N657DRAFT_1021 [Parathielavia appendiculata]
MVYPQGHESSVAASNCIGVAILPRCAISFPAPDTHLSRPITPPTDTAMHIQPRKSRKSTSVSTPPWLATRFIASRNHCASNTLARTKRSRWGRPCVAYLGRPPHEAVYTSQMAIGADLGVPRIEGRLKSSSKRGVEVPADNRNRKDMRQPNGDAYNSQEATSLSSDPISHHGHHMEDYDQNGLHSYPPAHVLALNNPSLALCGHQVSIPTCSQPRLLGRAKPSSPRNISTIHFCPNGLLRAVTVRCQLWAAHRSPAQPQSTQ